MEAGKYTWADWFFLIFFDIIIIYLCSLFIGLYE